MTNYIDVLPKELRVIIKYYLFGLEVSEYLQDCIKFYGYNQPFEEFLDFAHDTLKQLIPPGTNAKIISKDDCTYLHIQILTPYSFSPIKVTEFLNNLLKYQLSTTSDLIEYIQCINSIFKSHGLDERLVLYPSMDGIGIMVLLLKSITLP